MIPHFPFNFTSEAVSLSFIILKLTFLAGDEKKELFDLLHVLQTLGRHYACLQS